MVAVEVRQQTLAWMVVDEVRQGTLGVDGRGEDEEEDEEDEEGRQATNIKSNNPHLAGWGKTTKHQTPNTKHKFETKTTGPELLSD